MEDDIKTANEQVDEYDDLRPNKSWGIASLITSILSLLLFLMPYIGLPLAIIGVVGAAKQKKIYPMGIANAGNVIGIIGIVINSVMLVFVLVGLAFLSIFGGL